MEKFSKETKRKAVWEMWILFKSGGKLAFAPSLPRFTQYLLVAGYIKRETPPDWAIRSAPHRGIGYMRYSITERGRRAIAVMFDRIVPESENAANSID